MDDGAERATHMAGVEARGEDEALVAAVTKYGACRSMIATHLGRAVSASSAASGGTITCAPR